jgi:hypothetical protein
LEFRSIYLILDYGLEPEVVGIDPFVAPKYEILDDETIRLESISFSGLFKGDLR